MTYYRGVYLSLCPSVSQSLCLSILIFYLNLYSLSIFFTFFTYIINSHLKDLYLYLSPFPPLPVSFSLSPSPSPPPLSLPSPSTPPSTSTSTSRSPFPPFPPPLPSPLSPPLYLYLYLYLHLASLVLPARFLFRPYVSSSSFSIDTCV